MFNWISSSDNPMYSQNSLIETVLLHGYPLLIKVIILHQKNRMRSYKQQITNSQQYTNSLKQRGRLDFWMDKSIFSNGLILVNNPKEER